MENAPDAFTPILKLLGCIFHIISLDVVNYESCLISKLHLMLKLVTKMSLFEKTAIIYFPVDDVIILLC